MAHSLRIEEGFDARGAVLESAGALPRSRAGVDGKNHFRTEPDAGSTVSVSLETRRRRTAAPRPQPATASPPNGVRIPFLLLRKADTVQLLTRPWPFAT